MARVAITQTLITRIVNTIKMLYQQDLDKACKQTPELWSGAIYDVLVPPRARAIMDQLPDNYFCRLEGAKVSFPGSYVINVNFAGNKFPFRLNNVPMYNISQYSTLHLGREDFDALPDGIKTIIKDRDNAILVATNKMNDAANAASLLLKQHKSLATALKEWPSLWNILPDDIKEQHKRIVERAPSRLPEKTEVDMSSVTAKLIANRIKGGNQ
jgi:hypothetical protein